ncbi:MAG: acetyl-CoA carboxylase [bacterium]
MNNPKPILITDTTLREVHQDRRAVRIRLEDILPIAEAIDQAGYHSVEVWGGANFEIALKYLGEDPWERLKQLRKVIKSTPLQMLLAGQNIVGDRPYPDDVLKAFVSKSVENGIKIFRIVDALNDVRNMKIAIATVKKEGGKVQGNICGVISPIHNLDYYLNCAARQVDLGIDSLCVKDTSGILTPYAAYNLVKAFKERFNIPVQMRCHSSRGLATATYLKAIEAGVDMIDGAVSAMAIYTALPAVETMAAVLEDTGYALAINLPVVKKISDYFEKVVKPGHLFGPEWLMMEAAGITSQIPCEMTADLISHLEEQHALSRLKEVLVEIPQVRKEMGYPALIPPIHQIIGNQSLLNVLTGERYKFVPKEVKAYFKGYYGRPPKLVDEWVRNKLLGEQEPIRVRPAETLEPAIPEAKKKLPAPLIEKEEDIITYCLFPKNALMFFEWRKDPAGHPSPAEEVLKEELRDKETLEVEDIIQFAYQEGLLELELTEGKKRIRIKGAISFPEEILAPVTKEEAKEEFPLAHLIPVISPLVGTFYRSPIPDQPPFVEEGDMIKEGDSLGIIEAMKLFNEIKSEVSGRVVKILVENAQTVEAGETLFLIEPEV